MVFHCIKRTKESEEYKAQCMADILAASRSDPCCLEINFYRYDQSLSCSTQRAVYAVPFSAMAVKQPAVQRDRLPTLQEVLNRSTKPPVDLYCYYLFLQREGAEDTLDFYTFVTSARTGGVSRRSGRATTRSHEREGAPGME